MQIRRFRTFAIPAVSARIPVVAGIRGTKSFSPSTGRVRTVFPKHTDVGHAQFDRISQSDTFDFRLFTRIDARCERNGVLQFYPRTRRVVRKFIAAPLAELLCPKAAARVDVNVR